MNVPANERDIPAILDALPCQRLTDLDEWPATLQTESFQALLSGTEGFPMDEMRRHVTDLHLGLNRPPPKP